MSKKKATVGRQRIPIAKIKNESHRQVTFSKRRAGLFKKASELCTLCGIETAMIVFSPAGKPFSFGHPSVESVLDRYISRNNLPISRPDENHQNASLRDLNSRLLQVLNDLDSEKKRGLEIENVRKSSRVGSWWEKPVDEMNFNELERLRVALEDLKVNVKKQGNETKTALIEPKVNTTSFWEIKGDVFSTFERKGHIMNPNQITSASGLSSNYNFAYGHGYMFDSSV